MAEYLVIATSLRSGSHSRILAEAFSQALKAKKADAALLDFRCVILPRFVYATGDDFADGKITGSEVGKRLKQLAEAAIRLRN